MVGYIGKSPTVGNFVKLDSITTSATTTFNLLNGGVAYSPESARVCLVSLNGVIQNPETAFNIVGSTIVFSQALTSDDVIDYILVLGDTLSVGVPSDATVSTAKIVDSAVTTAKVNDSAITTAKVNDSAITTAKIGNDAVDKDKINLVSTSSSAGLEVKGDGTTDGYIQLNCSQNSHGIKIKSAPHSANASYTLTLPNNDGNADEVLKTDGSGVLSWGAVSSDFVKLSSGSMSSADTLTFDSLDTSTYKAFRIIISDVVCLANFTQLRGRFRYDNSGSQADRTDSNYWTQTQGHRTGPAGSGGRSVIDYGGMSYFQLNEYLTQYDRPSTQCFDIVLYDIANTNGHKSIQINSSGGQDTTGTDYYFYLHGNGFYRNTGANNGFTIYTANSDNFTGNYQIYGIK